MAEIDELRSALDALNAATGAKIDSALAASGPERQALIAEVKRLQRQAGDLARAILDWNEGRLQSVVATLEQMVAEERAAQSDVVGRLEALAARLRARLGSAPGPDSGAGPAPSPAPSQPPATGADGPPSPGPAVDPNRRDTDISRLHPVMREKLDAVIADLKSVGIPMKVFEAWRSPERQRMLFGKGRANGQIVDRSKVVTFADAWHSYHQYGLAVDMVIDNPPMNPWETAGEAGDWWSRYHEIARAHGLEPLSFELPHIQVAGTRSSLLLAGDYPDGGDAAWADALAEAISRWPDRPRPPARGGGERPAMPGRGMTGLASAGIDWAALPPVRECHFTNRFGGQSWRVDRRGVYLAGAPGMPQRTPGTPQTTARIVELYGASIAECAAKYGMPPELLVMTIATETAAFRRSDFTGPDTFRWEAHFKVRNTGDSEIDGEERGDYSAGPMQVMADTARGLNRQENLGYDAETVFRFFRNKPAKPPATLGLYEPAVCIDVGACYIRRQLAQTEGNPVLVAAAYNAGSLRASGTNLWGIHAHGDHLDRACRWFGDACEVLAAFGR